MKVQDLLAPVDQENQENTSSDNSSKYIEHISESEDDLLHDDKPKNSKRSATKDDNKVQKPNLTNSERQMIYDLLNRSSFNGKLPRGILRELSLRFKVKPRTISRIWHQGQESVASGKEANVSSRIKLKSGRKKNLINPKLWNNKGYEGVRESKVLAFIV